MSDQTTVDSLRKARTARIAAAFAEANARTGLFKMTDRHQIGRIKTPRRPVEDAADFWRREAELQKANLDAARIENIRLECHIAALLRRVAELEAANGKR